MLATEFVGGIPRDALKAFADERQIDMRTMPYEYGTRAGERDGFAVEIAMDRYNRMVCALVKYGPAGHTPLRGSKRNVLMQYVVGKKQYTPGTSQEWV